MNTSGVQSFIVASDSGNGGQVTHEDVVKMIEDLEDVNADRLGDPGWLTTPGIKSLLKLTARLANTIALPVWTDNGRSVRLWGQKIKPGAENVGPRNDLDNHALILGVWATMLIGMWGADSSSSWIRSA
jgi:hypothetical protein